MKSALSVFFNIDRTYIAILSPSKKGLSLEYVNATRSQIDLENVFDPDNDPGIQELREFMLSVQNKINRVSVTIPAESVFVSQFPGQKGMTNEQLNKLVNLEIKQAYPQYNTDEFVSNIIPMEKNIKGSSMMLASIMQKDIINTCKDIFKDYLPVTNIEVSQLNAHTAFLYNYPESIEKNIMILGVQDQFIDLSIVKNTRPAYYNLLSFANKEKLGEIIKEQYHTLQEEIIEKIDGIYYFGTGLTKELSIHAKELADSLGVDSGRINAFRMVESNVDDRQKDYCKVMQHVFPPCIGAVIPAYHERIRLL